jgi:uncharacterized membrane protein
MGLGWDMNFGGWIWIGVWIVALLLMVWFITRSPDPYPATQQPHDILRTRFARGEISQAEFEQARRVLDPEKEPRN